MRVYCRDASAASATRVRDSVFVTTTGPISHRNMVSGCQAAVAASDSDHMRNCFESALDRSTTFRRRSAFPALAFLVVGLLSLSTYVCAQELEASFDWGVSWTPYSGIAVDNSSAPTTKLVRFGEARAELSGCVDNVQVVRATKGGKPLGLRWTGSDECGADDTGALVLRDFVARKPKPDWMAYMREPSRMSADNEQATNGTQGNKAGKEKGFFSKYGIYIMLVIGVALAQGIKLGMDQFQREMEIEDAERRQKAQDAALRGQTRVRVPRRKDTKQKKKKAATASS